MIFSLIKKIFRVHYQATVNLINHDGVEHSGYMAFITLLSFFPFIIFLMAITSSAGKFEHGRELIFSITNLIPADLIQAINPRIQEIIDSPPTSLLTISIISIIWTSSSTVEGMRTILNKIHNKSSPPPYLWRRMLSILQFLLITAILIASMIFLFFIPIVYDWLSHLSHIKPILQASIEVIGRISGSILENFRHLTFVLTLFFSVLFLYYSIPNTKMRVKYLIPGTIEVVILWMIGASLLSKYVYLFTQLNVVYGSLAGMIITLLFFYLIHIIFIYGAEINAILSEDKKSFS